MNINEFTYTKLKTECARLGLGGSGTKQELSIKLDRFLKGEETQKEYVAETDNSDVSPDEVIGDESKSQGQILLENEDELNTRKVEHETEWEKIKARLDLIFAGRVQFYLQENCPGNYSVVFKGTARQSESINITAGIKTIERIALQYVRPTSVYITQGGDTPEQAMKKFEAGMK